MADEGLIRSILNALKPIPPYEDTSVGTIVPGEDSRAMMQTPSGIVELPQDFSYDKNMNVFPASHDPWERSQILPLGYNKETHQFGPAVPGVVHPMVNSFRKIEDRFLKGRYAPMDLQNIEKQNIARGMGGTGPINAIPSTAARLYNPYSIKALLNAIRGISNVPGAK